MRPVKDTQKSKFLSLDFPLIQAPMAGGITTPELVGVVSEERCLGTLAGGYLTTAELDDLIKKTKKITSKPFAVNLFVPSIYKKDQSKISAMQEKLNVYRRELQIEEKFFIDIPQDHFEEQIDIIIQHDIPICSFTFGLPSKKIIRTLKNKKIIMIGTATNITEGKMLFEAGFDAVVAQGKEAGGHRGTFYGNPMASLFPVMELVKALTKEITIPIIAAGGIMQVEDIKHALVFGAQAVQMGTAFLTCQESGATASYKEAILRKNIVIKLTRAFSGKLANAVVNRMMLELNKLEDIIPDYPVQHYLTLDIRKVAAQKNIPDLMALYVGEKINQIKSACSAKEIIDEIKYSLMSD